VLIGCFSVSPEQLCLEVSAAMRPLKGWLLGIAAGVQQGMVFSLLFGLKTAFRTADSDIKLSGAPRFSVAAANRGAKLGGMIGATVGAIFGLVSAIVFFLHPPWTTEDVPYAILLDAGAFIVAAIGFGIAGAITGALFNSVLRGDIPKNANPGKGVIFSGQTALLTGVVVATFLATGVLILLSFIRYVDHLLSSSPEWQLLPIHDVVQSELSTDVGGIAYSAIWWGVTAAIWYGGFDIVGNFILRILLQRHEHIPKDFVRFLDYTTRLTFTQQVGPAYIAHRELLSYFADLLGTEKTECG
jgi:hypothetical protein